MLEALPAPLSPVLGPELAAVCARLHADHGTDLRCGVTVDGLDAAGVHLADGTSVPADVVVVGVGMTPATDWLAGSGLTVGNGVHTDAGLVTAEPGERRRVRYRLRSAPMKVAQQFLAALARDWDSSLDALRDHLENSA